MDNYQKKVITVVLIFSVMTYFVGNVFAWEILPTAVGELFVVTFIWRVVLPLFRDKK